MTPLAGGLAVLLCGLGGLAVPRVIGALPEPAPDAAPDPSEDEPEGGDHDEADQLGPPRRSRKPPPDFSLWGLHAIERDKEPYADIARVPHLALASAAASALVGALVAWRLGWVPALAVVLPVVPLGVALTVIDWRTRLLPTRLVLAGTAYVLAAGLVIWPLTGSADDLKLALVGLVVFRSALWVLNLVYPAGMGFGDVRLAALVGFALGYVGPAELVIGSYAGFLVFSLPGLLLALVRRSWALMRVGFPYGPFMLLGGLLGILCGDAILSAVLH